MYWKRRGSSPTSASGTSEATQTGAAPSTPTASRQSSTSDRYTCTSRGWPLGNWGSRNCRAGGQCGRAGSRAQQGCEGSVRSHSLEGGRPPCPLPPLPPPLMSIPRTRTCASLPLPVGAAFLLPMNIFILPQ